MPAEALPEPHPRALLDTTSADIVLDPVPDQVPVTDPSLLSTVQTTGQVAARALTVTPLVTVDDVITLGRLGTISTGLRAAISAHLDGLLANLELALNRPLQVREFVEDVPIGEDGRLWLAQTPVVEILSVTSIDWTGTVTMSTVTDPRAYSWRPGVTVRVTYTAGLDPDRYGAAVRAVVASKALSWVRGTLARERAASAAGGAGAGQDLPVLPGGVKAFSVEGLNVTYETGDESVANALKTAAAEAAAAGWTPEELAALGSLRKVVVA